MDKQIKLTFLGDILCSQLQNNASFKKGRYCYDDAFEDVRDYFSKSDYVCGNLETPIAGKELIFTDHLTVFNPNQFIRLI